MGMGRGSLVRSMVGGRLRRVFVLDADEDEEDE